LEHVLPHVRLTGDELDRAGGAFELPEVTAAGDGHETFHGSPVVVIVEHDRRRDFVPIPGVIGMILEMSLDRAAAHVESNNRGGVGIAPGPLADEPGAAIARPPEAKIGLGIVGAGNPDRGAAALIVVAARRPGLAARLARRRYCVGFPERLARLSVERS